MSGVAVSGAGQRLAELERLAAEQDALRRVATMVARRCAPSDVFAQVAEELSRLLEVDLVRTVRFEPDGSATVLASRGSAQDRLGPGTNVPLPGGTVIDQVFRTGRPARIEGYEQVTGPVGDVLRKEGARSGAGGPIVVDGRLWGAMAIGSTTRTLGPGTEARVARFAELVSTAISNLESREKVERLAAEQSALRRVATLVAEGTSADELFALVSAEVGRLFCAEAAIARFEPDGSALVIVGLTSGIPVLSVGTRVALEDYLAATAVYCTGRPARRRYTKGALERFATEYGGDRADSGDVAGGPREMNFVSSVAAPIVVGGSVWGAMTVDQANGDLPPDTEERLESFTELVASAISNAASRGELAASEARARRLAEEQSALRRVATLVARAPASEPFFSTVAREVGSVLNVAGVIVQRYETDGTVVTFGEAFDSDLAGAERVFGVGTQMPRDPGSLAAQVFETHRPARVDDFSTLPGTVGDLARAAGLGSGCAGPIEVNGVLWGKMCVFSRAGTVLPLGMEDRLQDFIELVGTAIANYESRASVERLAAEQSALRRVATLVAREYSPEDLFATLAEEVGVLLEVDASAILRYEAGSTATVVAGWSAGAITIPLGRRFPLEGQNLAGEVHGTGKPRRKEDYEAAAGPIAETVRELGIRGAVASPIVVEGATWGVIAVLSRKPEPLPADTEVRLAEFSRHAGMAVANAKSRSDLAESRARIVRAGDEARRRFERDLHDGAQQRLVSLGLELRSAEATVPPELGDLQPRLARLGTGVREVLDDLRELSRGLHPAVLSEDGLRPALSSLALRSAVPVSLRLDIGGERFEEPVEVAGYYVASEALANTAKHARASRAEVSVTRAGGWLELTVSDDGQGGADVAGGSGLIGLVDRVEAIGGTVQIDSRPGLGTVVHVKLPVNLAPS
jgi:signal transduction histidine kinase